MNAKTPLLPLQRRPEVPSGSVVVNLNSGDGPSRAPVFRQPSRQPSHLGLRISDFLRPSAFGFRISPRASSLLSGALLLSALSLLLLPRTLLAGLPQPMCVYYGQALDGYGLPYRTNAQVLLYHGTNIIASQTIGGSLTPGVNFALYVHLDDGRSPVPYSSRALHSGDLVSIMVRDADGLKTIMENDTVPTVGQPGELITIKATAAEDLNHDGLPDPWEWELIAWSGGKLRTLDDVRPGDDFDGDGMTNLQEYQAGTFPFLNYDYFHIEQCERTPAGRMQLTFLSVAGKVYSADCATNLTQAVWAPCPFALSDTASMDLGQVEGNGDWLSLYVPIQEPACFFRLGVR